MGIIRFYLAICVVFAHVPNDIPFISVGGKLAVEAFFIISGFYMAMILTEKYVGPGSYMFFISNRFLKIYPVYFTIVGFSILLYLMFGSNDNSFISNFLGDTANFKAMVFLALANIIIIGQDIVMFLGLDNGELIYTHDFNDSNIKVYKFLALPPAWSLSLELIFYIIAPFLVGKSNRLLLILISTILICKTLFLKYVYNNDPWTYRLFIFELPYFLMGVLAYKKMNSLESVSSILILKLSLSSGLIVLLMDAVFFNRTLTLDHKYWFDIVFLILFTLFLPCIFSRTKKSVFDRKLGDYSYPIYLVHWPIMIYIVPMLDIIYKGEVVLLLSTIVSFCLIYFIITPIEKYRTERVSSLKCKNM